MSGLELPSIGTADDKGGAIFSCGLFDTEMVRKIAEMLLPGLATACVDHTTGDVFRTPASVAVDLRKEFVEYLTHRSETFLAESVILEGEVAAEASDDPYEVVCLMVDDFDTMKRNLLGRISSWLLSELREDKIDDVVQEMEMSKFWSMDRREALAQTLLRNVDYKAVFHCESRFNFAEDLAEHGLVCKFRSADCSNEGCNVRFVAAHMDHHDVVCPFKVLLCEQNCPASILRREMDRHCITVCPMKTVNCNFYSLGCRATVPQSNIEKHISENLRDHILLVLQRLHKDASPEDLKRRAEQLESLASEKIRAMQDVRSLTFSIRDLDSKVPELPASETVSSGASDEEHQVTPGIAEITAQVES
ncbi:hypothetical protein MLD38_007972 [Melastoma candidum]|uniref:Uncharacterized protein n=1 Tax=Melastoma candidum TaxID=119954 RepID=A0ACB9RSI9_9MYRT|nr:hypothetical protein MLD38_007972 [Melastoma candidum]